MRKKRLIWRYGVLSLWIAIISLALICNSYAEEGHVSWRFDKVDTFGRYTRILLKKVNKNYDSGFVIDEPEMHFIIQYFGVKKPEDLVGKVFTGEDPHSELIRIAKQAKDSGNYQPYTSPMSNPVISEHQAISIADRKLKEFCKYEKEPLDDAFCHNLDKMPYKAKFIPNAYYGDCGNKMQKEGNNGYWEIFSYDNSVSVTVDGKTGAADGPCFLKLTR